jgi:hypothetical protein
MSYPRLECVTLTQSGIHPKLTFNNLQLRAQGLVVRFLWISEQTVIFYL